ncbi:hypothetical protein FRACYDRAFT_238348 [Fragilariopsis cylindrus CCMP1102]|uniref:Ankyrin n=1 Tax=Fragilariopsis cylindrus CCMP1102 TaxID=635003 RepID=A0A1E7FID4_9STRA|nr:hypothetical protein FRACYDRAFT_238348 [Fragilariopsis cylindrus CCMP1102]|eukprot:OEU17918.1 hypothetical protein FRACYDRAFT_238348 [Fragilariopsis cylindrus CCMP1102]
MDTNNIDNDDDDDHQQVQQEQQAAAAAAAAVADQRHSKIMSVLKRKKKFTLRHRKQIDELVETFLEALEQDIYDMLCDNDFDNYHGLDSDRDTEEEVETTLRCFPELLSRRNDDYFHYPIHSLPYLYDVTNENIRCNLKAVSFIPLVARLSIEFGCFNEVFRGGLLFEIGRAGCMPLCDLMLTDTLGRQREHHETVDNKYLIVMKQLRHMGLLKKEDIQNFGLLRKYKYPQGEIDGTVFPEERFRFLAEWDPIALTQTYISDSRCNIPLHQAALGSSMEGFQLVFETGIRYFPKKKGISLLFQKNIEDETPETPFATACSNYGLNDVIKVVEKCLSDSSDKPNSFSEAFLSAAVNEDIHLDCVYFLLRRDPDMLQKLLPASLTTSSVKHSKRKRKRNNINDKGDDGKTCKT